MVANDLLGKYLVRNVKGEEISGKIIETEAYIGPQDLACHAARGRTSRTEVMYGEAGRFYIYFTYGMHFMLNVVTDSVDYPAAVLIRGLDNVSGPGRLTKKLQIGRDLNGKVASKKSGMWFEDLGIKVASKNIIRTPRIGVAYAGVWAKKLYRFVLVQRF